MPAPWSASIAGAALPAFVRASRERTAKSRSPRRLLGDRHQDSAWQARRHSQRRTIDARRHVGEPWLRPRGPRRSHCRAGGRAASVACRSIRPGTGLLGPAYRSDGADLGRHDRALRRPGAMVKYQFGVSCGGKEVNYGRRTAPGSWLPGCSETRSFHFARCRSGPCWRALPDEVDFILRPIGFRPWPSDSSRRRPTGSAGPARDIREWSARAALFLRYSAYQRESSHGQDRAALPGGIGQTTPPQQNQTRRDDQASTDYIGRARHLGED